MFGTCLQITNGILHVTVLLLLLFSNWALVFYTKGHFLSIYCLDYSPCWSARQGVVLKMPPFLRKQTGVGSF
jgi:hypothetical protein